MKSLLLIGAAKSDKHDDDDYELLKSAANDKGRIVEDWGCTKDTEKDDELWFYITEPVSAIVATGVALNDSQPGKNFRYVVNVGKITWITNHVSLRKMRQLIPTWGQGRVGKRHLTEQQAQVLRKQLSVPTAQKPSKESGAGYGNAERNAEVEKSAVNFVTKSYEAQGYEVRSVEADKCGYDLVAKRRTHELHLEVKGVSGDVPEFQITKNEVESARNDEAFRLVVVVNALEKHRRAIELSGSQFLERYDLRPDSFRAVQKR